MNRRQPPATSRSAGSSTATTGVLANDTDADTPAAGRTAVLVSGPAHGTLTLNTNGSFTYAPAADFNGTDTFVYQAFDGTGLSAPTTVTLTGCGRGAR